jgi:hypothetical protein
MAIQCTAADYHLRSTSSFLNISSTAPFSIAVWLNASWTDGNTYSFVGIYGPTNSNDSPTATPVTALQIGTKTGQGNLVFWTWGGTTLTATSTGVMNAFNNKWCHVTYTYDGTTHRGYVNGKLVTSTVGSNTAGFLKQIYINGYPGATTNETSTHQVDAYMLYNRALRDDEILTISSARGSRHAITYGLLVWHEFDEQAQGTSVTNVVDLTKNGVNLTNVSVGTPGAPATYTYINTLANSNLRPVQ